MGKVLHASESGYFTNCIHSQEVLVPSYYPASTSLKDAMKIFWRVRSWRVEGYITDQIAYPEYKKEDGSTFIPASEEELVCGKGFSIVTNDYSGNNFETITFYIFNYDLLGSGIGKNNSNAYVPKLLFEAVYYDGNVTTEGYSDFDYGALAGTFNLVGSGFGEIQLYTSPGVPGGSWTITPEEYWSYGGTYNTSTGEPS